MPTPPEMSSSTIEYVVVGDRLPVDLGLEEDRDDVVARLPSARGDRLGDGVLHPGDVHLDGVGVLGTADPVGQNRVQGAVPPPVVDVEPSQSIVTTAGTPMTEARSQVPSSMTSSTNAVVQRSIIGSIRSTAAGDVSGLISLR